MKGAFLTNRYYTDDGSQYAFDALKRAFGDRVLLQKISPLWHYDKEIYPKFDFDFIFFWDKDYYLAAALKKQGIKIFNDPEVLMLCDDKQKTYAALNDVNIPKTISAPLMYDINAGEDTEFLSFVGDTLGFPLVVKENSGSQGRQVYKAENAAKLRELYLKLRHTPHHYQKMTGVFGEDLRVYTIGGKAVAACRRFGIDFKSNLGAGGRMELAELKPEYKKTAESISRQLKMDYGSVDFLVLENEDKPVFLEANSNAYFRGIESLGASIAAPIAEHILKQTLKFKTQKSKSNKK